MFCRIYNNKKYCVHKVPKMNARDIVLKQLREMKITIDLIVVLWRLIIMLQ